MLKSIDDSLCETRKDFDMEVDRERAREKVLGMLWNRTSDLFTYSLKFTKGTSDVLSGLGIPTKRQVLQVLASIYDPLGFLSDYLIYPKILMQDIWRSAIGWNDLIQEPLVHRGKCGYQH